MHTLTTHIRPHLDDICGMWLFKRYLPDAKNAKLDFIATNAHGGDTQPDPGIIYLGVGRGEFDEHKGDIGQCTTSLVFADLANRVPLEPIERSALEKLVNWVLQEDTGMLLTAPFRQCAFPSIIEGFFDSHDRDSLASTEFGFQMLDAIMVVLRGEARIERDWALRKEFTSKWGKAVAVTSDVRHIDAYAYRHGFMLVVIVTSSGLYHAVRGNPKSEVDLSESFETLKVIDPGAGWFLHHSKRLLLCGGDHAPDVKTSAMSLDNLVSLVSAKE